MTKYTNFQDFCIQGVRQGQRSLTRYLKPGKNSLKLALEDAKKQGLPQELIYRVEERGMLDGSFELTYEGAERIYNRIKTTLSSDEAKIIDSFDSTRDADLIANYLFCLNPEIRSKLEKVENVYKVVLKLRSKKDKSKRIQEKSDQQIVSPNETTPFISEYTKSLIANVPRGEFTGDFEYQRRLRVLLRKKVERDMFPAFKENPEEVFRILDGAIEKADNENIRDVYNEARQLYKEYTTLETLNVNPLFTDPQTGERGVLPSLHQRIALYHLIKEITFGVFDGCGTGKTAIATLAQPLIEREMRSRLENRIEGERFMRTVVVCPNPAKKAWKNGLIGEANKRYLADIDEEEVMVINGGKKSEDFLDELKRKKWIVVNYDQLISETREGRLLIDELLDLGIDYLVSDECHRIKSKRNETKGKRPTLSAAFRRLATNAEYLCLLSGSPMTDSMEDYAVLFHLLHRERLPDPADFNKIYEENPRVLYTLFNEKTIRRTSEDINEDLELEPNDELVELSSVQKNSTSIF